MPARAPKRLNYAARVLPVDAIAPVRRYVVLDMLRAVAAIAVVASHVYLLNGVSYLGNRHLNVLFWAQGATGVWLFFVLSGFVISRPFVTGLIRGELPNVRHYAIAPGLSDLPAFLALAAGGVAGHQRVVGRLVDGPDSATSS